MFTSTQDLIRRRHESQKTIMELQSATRESWNRTWATDGAIAHGVLIDDDVMITRITIWRVLLPHYQTQHPSHYGKHSAKDCSTSPTSKPSMELPEKSPFLASRGCRRSKQPIVRVFGGFQWFGLARQWLSVARSGATVEENVEPLLVNRVHHHLPLARAFSQPYSQPISPAEPSSSHPAVRCSKFVQKTRVSYITTFRHPLHIAAGPQVFF